MGAAIYLVLEREIDGVDTDMDGKSLSRHLKALDKAARELGVKPLLDFHGMDPEEFMDFTGSDSAPPLEHFSASEGLAVIRALAGHAVAQDDGVAEDLRDCERILIAAEEHGVGWHFEVDY